MNQDQIIRWLMENIDANALTEAQRNGSTIMYFAGVAQRWPNNNTTATSGNTPRPARPAPIVREENPQNETPIAQNQTQPTQNTIRQQTRRNGAARYNEGDTVRVGNF